MSRRDEERLEDILAAARAIAEHLERGSLDDGLVFDAVRVRHIEIGEAVKSIDPALLDREPTVPWIDVAAPHPPRARRVRAGKLTPSLLRSWLAGLTSKVGGRGKPLAPGTVAQAYRTLNQVLAAAVDDEISAVTRSPA